MTTMPIDNHPLTQRRLQFIGISVNKLTLKSIDIIQSSDNYNIVSSFTGFTIKLNVWGSLGLNFEYDGGPIIEIGGPIFLYKLRILEGSTFFREGLV